MTPPAVDGSDSTNEALKARYGDPEKDSTVEVSPVARLHWDRRTVIKAEIKALETERQGIENTLAELIGDHEKATVDGVVLYRWSKVERDGYEVKPTSFRQFGNPRKND
jgi:predicted phage-related endonuclease